MHQESQKGQHLLVELEGVWRQIAELSHSLEINALRLQLLDLLDDLLRGRFSVHLGGGEEVVALRLREEIRRRAQIEKHDTGQVETDGPGVLTNLLLGLLKGDEQTPFVIGGALSEKVKAKDRLPRARPAPYQVRSPWHEAPVQDLVQSGHARGQPRRWLFVIGVRHGNPSVQRTLVAEQGSADRQGPNCDGASRPKARASPGAPERTDSFSHRAVDVEGAVQASQLEDPANGALKADEPEPATSRPDPLEESHQCRQARAVHDAHAYEIDDEPLPTRGQELLQRLADQRATRRVELAREGHDRHLSILSNADIHKLTP